MMTDDEKEAIRALPTFARQQSRVGALIDQRLADGTFTITGWLLLGEPWRSLGWQHLDGVGVKDGLASYFASEPRELPPVLLVGCRAADGMRAADRVVTASVKQVAVIGSDRTRPEKVYEDRGAWAVVRDTYPGREARMLVFRQGWGVRGDTSLATVVEWKFLAQQVSSDKPFHGAVELHAEILARHGNDPKFCEAAGLPAPSDKKGGSK